MNFSRLTTAWRQWAPGIGGGDISVSAECDDCEILFSSADYSVHLHNDRSWWVVDMVDDRGGRRNGAAKLSSFDLAEKYLIWDWATTAHSSLASGPLGADLARRGYAPGVEVSQAERGHKIYLNDDCAILSVVNAKVFSHLMSKSVDEIEQMVRQDLTR
jgi:hypothetical protein